MLLAYSGLSMVSELSSRCSNSPFGSDAEEFFLLSWRGESVVPFPTRSCDAERRDRIERPDLTDDPVSVRESGSPFLDLEGLFPMAGVARSGG